MKIQVTVDWSDFEPLVLGYLGAVLKREITSEQLASFSITSAYGGGLDKVIAEIQLNVEPKPPVEVLVIEPGPDQ